MAASCCGSSLIAPYSNLEFLFTAFGNHKLGKAVLARALASLSSSQIVSRAAAFLIGT